MTSCGLGENMKLPTCFCSKKAPQITQNDLPGGGNGTTRRVTWGNQPCASLCPALSRSEGGKGSKNLFKQQHHGVWGKVGSRGRAASTSVFWAEGKPP